MTVCQPWHRPKKVVITPSPTVTISPEKVNRNKSHFGFKLEHPVSRASLTWPDPCVGVPLHLGPWMGGELQINKQTKNEISHICLYMCLSLSMGGEKRQLPGQPLLWKEVKFFQRFLHLYRFLFIDFLSLVEQLVIVGFFSFFQTWDRPRLDLMKCAGRQSYGPRCWPLYV